MINCKARPQYANLVILERLSFCVKHISERYCNFQKNFPCDCNLLQLLFERSWIFYSVRLEPVHWIGERIFGYRGKSRKMSKKLPLC